ncbi:hypothetical protein Pint_29602 [Pistacia integerrima]|uniref:Uncharacterized protein n=1 Tax=Pistacia integerrima TaxID=434235 RepID=A0ACC0X3P8_9ROSI|nr:hypothetical protein Pint_29602 [Pistacia integerrima]
MYPIVFLQFKTTVLFFDNGVLQLVNLPFGQKKEVTGISGMLRSAMKGLLCI